MRRTELAIALCIQAVSLGAAAQSPTADWPDHILLYAAIIDHRLDDLRAWIDAHPEAMSMPGSTGFTPLHLAIQARSEAAARLLLARGAKADPATRQDAPLLYAASFLPPLVPVLLDAGARIDARDSLGRTALHRAVQTPSLVTARLLIERGADVDARDGAGATPLALLADPDSGSVEGEGLLLAQLLIEHRASLDARDGNGRTLLHRCAHRDLLALARLLLRMHAMPDLTDARGRTPLYEAAEYGSAAVAALLLAAGADPNVRGADGATPLHVAAGGMQGFRDYDPPRNAMEEIHMTSEGQLTVVEALLRAGADRDAKDEHGRTPLDLAEGRGFTAVTARLRAH